jgi:hypothetical protein
LLVEVLDQLASAASIEHHFPLTPALSLGEREFCGSRDDARGQFVEQVGLFDEALDPSRYGPKGSLRTACLPAISFFPSAAVRAIIDSRTEN